MEQVMDVTEQVSILLDNYGADAVLKALQELEVIEYELIPVISPDYVFVENTSGYFN